MSRRKSPRPPANDPPRLMAKWQRAGLWGVWLTFFGLCVANWDRGEFSFREFLALGAAIAATVFCLSKPMGRPMVVISKPEELQGEFRSRINLPFVLISALLTLVGIAVAFKIVHDLSHGLTSIRGILEDFLLFFLEMVIERISGGVAGDVTHTKLYILIALLPFGALLFWLSLIPWIHGGVPFRVSDKGQLGIRIRGEWQAVKWGEFRKVRADGITIDFLDPVEGANPITLPLERVFSDRYETRVANSVIAEFVRLKLEQTGFQIESPAKSETATWTAILAKGETQGT